jgi:hypothetical protein
MLSVLFTGNVNIWVSVLAEESWTVTEKVTGPDAVGVPVKAPPLARFSQLGRPVAVNVYPPVPPVAVKVVPLYRMPVVAGARGDVVTNANGTIVGTITGKIKLPDVMFPNESVTVTENATDVTPDGGVPVSTPAGLRPSQLGSPVALHS